MVQQNVLQILFSGLGGHGSVAFSLIEGDQEKDWRHQMLFYGIEPLKDEYAHKCRKLHVPFKRVIKTKRNLVSDWWRVLRALSIFKPDVILLHSLTLVLPVGLYCRVRGCKLIVVEHTPNQVKKLKEQKASALAMRLADKVVLLTDLYKAELQAILGSRFQEERVVVINNGINTERFCPAPAPAGEKRIGMAGRFTHSKDFAGLVHAFRIFIENGGHPDVKLVLAGDGATLPLVKKLVADLNLQGKVVFTGNLNEHELISFLQSLTVYVHASKGETMSTAIMQAMACGLPIVATNIPGINNLVQHDDSGLLVKPDDYYGLSSAMTKLLEDDSLRSDFARISRTFAVDLLSNRRMFMQYHRLIELIFS